MSRKLLHGSSRAWAMLRQARRTAGASGGAGTEQRSGTQRARGLKRAS
jgi:hypothetical protein